MAATGPLRSPPDEASGRGLERLAASPGAVAAIVAAGVALRLVQYAANGSLWVDEAVLARIVVERPVTQAMPPGQVAPLGFLLVEKAIVRLLGNHELVLRLFPLLCSLAALALLPRLAARVLTGLGRPLAVLLFALGPGLVWYGPQVKQYASEMLASLAIWLLAVDVVDQGLTVEWAWWLGAAGVVAACFTQAVVFTLAGVGLALAVIAVRSGQRDAVPALAVLAGCWGAAVAFTTWVSMTTLAPAYRAYLNAYWAGAFMPLPPRTLADLLWPFKRSAMLYGELLLSYHYALAPFFLVLALAGVWSLARRCPAVALVLFLPVALTMAAAAARLYPFAGGRENAFLIAVYVLATAEGTEYLRARSRLGGHALVAAVVGVALYALATSRFPYLPEHLRPALAGMRARWRDGDVVYVYYGSEPAFRYYAPGLGFTRADYVVGRCARTDPRRYLAELDRLRGRRRVWIVLTHDDLFNEKQVIFGYLDRIGRRVDADPIPARSDVLTALYDLSDPLRLASVAADTYPVRPPPDATGAQCWNGVDATPP